jgi:hypothetical protein
MMPSSTGDPIQRLRGLALIVFLLGLFLFAPLTQPIPSQAQSANATSRLFLPVIYRDYQPTPLYATSYYIQDETPARMYDLGCALGTRDRNLPGAQDSMVVLNFGQGWFDGGNLNKPGAGLFSPYWHYVPISAIEAAVKAYIQGYWACSAEDQESQIMVAIGTNNYGGYGSNTTDQNTRRTYAYEHGKVWAQMVVRLIQWVWSSGYSRQVSVAGAIDIEWDSQLTGWNTPYVTYGWVNGFDNYDNGQAIFYNFGACVGCPTSANPNWVYSSTNPWTQFDVYYVSYGAPPAWPLPEIYATSGVNARQWQAISRYGAIYLGRPMEFAGVMTQYQACQQRGGCSGINNTPEAGWKQLFDALNADPLTRQPILRWITDIRWQIK